MMKNDAATEYNIHLIFPGGQTRMTEKSMDILAVLNDVHIDLP
jgi:hypothetical protein